jgi:N-acetylglucosaminyldiphosphoundecaprenol N-acetyl-beta-D-mannosaminyltransferase
MHTSSSSVRVPMSLQECDLFGVPITCFASYQEAVSHITDRVRARDKTYCVAINPLKVSIALKNPAFAQIVKNGGIHICDGIGTALAVRFLHGRSVRRITGVQLFFDLVAASEKTGLRVFLLGGSPESNQLAQENLRKRYPGLNLVGRHHGYFKEEEPVVHMINATQPDILFVAMGSPKQEYWIAAHRDQLDAPFIMGVGGTFDVVSGKAKWAPVFFRRTGTEFLYRFCMQPKRILGFPILFRFALTVLKERIYPQSTERQSYTEATP